MGGATSGGAFILQHQGGPPGGRETGADGHCCLPTQAGVVQGRLQGCAVVIAGPSMLLPSAAAAAAATSKELSVPAQPARARHCPALPVAGCHAEHMAVAEIAELVPALSAKLACKTCVSRIV